LRVAFAGTPQFALPALAALIAQHDVVGVLTQPDRPSGRGRQLTASAVKQAALAAQLPLAQPHTLAGDAAAAQLRAWLPDVLVAVAYGLILPREILLIPRLGGINIHASLLPRWRGAAPIERALLAGDTESGVTIMQMDTGLDTGPILLQRRIAISAAHTAGSLRDELAALGAAALLEALQGLSAATLSPRPQPQEGATYAPKIEKTEARIDWKGDAAQIERQIRAFNPWPVAETLLDGEQLRIFAAHVVPAGSSHTGDNVTLKLSKSFHPGVIVAVNDESIVVRCGRGDLALTQVQRPGRRRVSVRDYAGGPKGLSLVGRQLG
jgi:methionyl-tRNA formyltransferase